MRFAASSQRISLWILWIGLRISTCSPVDHSSIIRGRPSSDSEHPLTNEYDSNRNQSEEFPCPHEILIEKEYVVLENGSLILPQDGHLYEYDSYRVKDGTAYVCPSYDEPTLEESESVSRELNFSREFLSCGHILMEPHEYELFANGTVFIEIYNKNYDPSNYYIQEHGVFVCIPDFKAMHANITNQTIGEVEKFSPVFKYVSYIGIIVSVISLFLHLAVFCSVSKVRNLPGYCLASLSLSLLVAYSCFISSSFVSRTDDCANLGLCVYYFFLTSFFWMNAIAFDVWRSFRVVMRELRISSHRVPWRRFLLYSTYSWMTPAILVTMAKVADSTNLLPEDFRPSFGQHLCWFGQRKALLVFFATPLCLIMALNAAFFLDSAYVISRATMKSTQVNEAVLRKRFFMFMRLALLMGLTWVVGIVAGYVDNEFLWYLFVVLNTLQGLFIFIVFSCSAKVRGLVLKSMGSDHKTRLGTSVRTISQASAL